MTDTQQIVDDLFASQHQLSEALDNFAATDPGKWTDADYDYIERAQKTLDDLNRKIYGHS